MQDHTFFRHAGIKIHVISVPKNFTIAFMQKRFKVVLFLGAKNFLLLLEYIVSVICVSKL